MVSENCRGEVKKKFKKKKNKGERFLKKKSGSEIPDKNSKNKDFGPKISKKNAELKPLKKNSTQQNLRTFRTFDKKYGLKGLIMATLKI